MIYNRSENPIRLLQRLSLLIGVLCFRSATKVVIFASKRVPRPTLTGSCSALRIAPDIINAFLNSYLHFEYEKNTERSNEFTDSDKSLFEGPFGHQKGCPNLRSVPLAERITLERGLYESFSETERRSVCKWRS